MRSWPTRFVNAIGASFALCAFTLGSSSAQVFTTILQFDGAHGAQPQASLVQGGDGYLYGTTTSGGDLTCGGGSGCGTVFRMSLSGQLTVLHTFTGEDGASPWGRLVLGMDGNFYGTTYQGGDLNCNPPGGCGTVFKITPEGELTILHTFEFADGTSPVSGLVQASGDNFYGTASAGGNDVCDSLAGCGTVFEISPNGTFRKLYGFSGSDGAMPTVALLLARDGSFYGTTFFGGSYDCDGTYGCGTVFKMSTRGRLTTLHTFDLSDGAFPGAAFVEGPDNGLYSTSSGGGKYNLGTVFKSTRSGAITLLHHFRGGDGALPYDPLIVGTDGNVYGTAYYGGSYGCSAPHGCGTVFQITRHDRFTKVHRFNGKDGSAPFGALIQATNGVFYGTTSQGANKSCFLGGCGTVFSLDMGLRPSVQQVPRQWNH